jgi:hypothetical protein
MKILYKSNNPNGDHQLKEKAAMADEFGRIFIGKTRVKQWATLGQRPVFCSEKDYFGYPDIRGVKL